MAMLTFVGPRISCWRTSTSTRRRCDAPSACPHLEIAPLEATPKHARPCSSRGTVHGKRLSNTPQPSTLIRLQHRLLSIMLLQRGLTGPQLGCAVQGLTTAQYKANLAKYGPNALTPPPTMPAWLKFLLQFTNFFALLLLAGGTLCFIGYGIDSSRTGEDVEADPTNVCLPPLLVYACRCICFAFLRELTTVVGVYVRAAVPRRSAIPRGDHHRNLLPLPGGQVGADHGGCDSHPGPTPQTTDHVHTPRAMSTVTRSPSRHSFERELSFRRVGGKQSNNKRRVKAFLRRVRERVDEITCCA